ncbi:hypothetical protein G647_02808 [Cladophialophora carrionii CBS 160.54]|uniref:FAD-binding FR-type domain-containing protein n=1 Tax=Cladophialophora carrionii CBS 160.54 TaxID=1279043 RepID=V9DH79_9EURO|nr:uncharacterized protein G647_02808 [Cladophialophora carrionii CBS 160.54]ETI26031.1 hypothetical protein G647_02808 [Cladophialophora carrionii CBS 160.54]
MDGTVLPDEFLHTLRLSLKPSSNLVDTLANTGGEPESDFIRKLIAAVLWHRKFVLTYYIWIAAVVVISCGFETYKRRRHRSNGTRSSNVDVSNDSAIDPTASSSSSSTLTGANTPPQKDVDEATPLLLQKETKERPHLRNRLASFLLYQPRPVPALTSPINTLPDNGTSLSILFFLALNLFYLFFRSPLSAQWIFILVDRAGLLFVVNLPVLYILAAKNNQPIKFLTGWSYEGLNIFHRRLGEWMTCFAVIHMFGMFVVWYTVLQPMGFTLLHYLTTKVVFLGICAIVSYSIIYITSIGWFRRLYYEAFLGLHIFFQLAALVFLFFHYPTAPPYVGAALAIWVIDRGIWRIATSSRKFIATLEVAPDGQTILLHAEIPLRQQKSASRIVRNLRYGWAPGQHVFLTIPSMGFKYRFQAHPFTIASPAPPANSVSRHLKSWPLQLTIRAIEGFSLDLLHYAKFHQHCEIVLDGPYGSVSALGAAHAASRVCFVAGGSGIAVTYPLAWDVRVSAYAEADAIVATRTVYENGRRKSPPATLECNQPIQKSKYMHFWVRQDERHKEWITMVPKATATIHDPAHTGFRYPDQAAQASRVEEVSSLITRAFDTRAPPPEGGRPDMKTEIWTWVTSIQAGVPSRSPSATTLEDAASEPSFDLSPNTKTSMGPAPSRDDKICIIVSGPDGLVRDVRNITAELVKQGWDIDVHVEKFGW